MADYYSYNHIVLVGRIATDITYREGKEIKKKRGGSIKPICWFNLCTKEIHIIQEEQKIDNYYHRVVCYGKTAKLMGQYLNKGMLVLVEGRLHQRPYINKEGLKRRISEVVIENIIFLERKKQLEKAEINKTKGGKDARGKTENNI